MKFLVSLAQSLETPTTAFMKAGLLGAAIVVLAGVVLYLYVDAKHERRELFNKLEGLHKSRVDDAQKITSEAVQALTEVANSSDAQAATNIELRNALVRLESEVSRLRK